MTKRTHRPLMWVFVCFASGIIIDEFIRVSFVLLSILTAILIIASAVTVKRSISTVFLLLAFICLGSIYSSGYQVSAQNHISKISYFDREEPVAIEGVVASDVEQRPFFKGTKTVLTLEVKRVKSNGRWRERQGALLVNIFREENLSYGDFLNLEGKLHRPFNYSKDSRFSYREYLYRRGITYILSVKKEGRVKVLARGQGNIFKDLSLRFKYRLADILKKYLSKKESGIMRAFLLGDRYDIPQNIYELFKISGVAHIIAISGFNIGIVAYVIFLVLKMFPIPRQWQYVLTMLLLIFYAFLTGGQPPVVRATIMASVFLISFIIEREHESINTLSAAALIILFLNPLNLFDVGFQLSFISVLFIIILYPKILNLFYKTCPSLTEDPEEKASLKAGPRIMRYLLQSMSISLSAYLGVVVLVAQYFQLVTPVVILANLVVVPLASLLIFLGMGLLAAGVICPAAAFAFANCISVVLNLMVASVYLFVQIPGAYFELKELPVWIIILYYGLILFCLRKDLVGQRGQELPVVGLSARD